MSEQPSPPAGTATVYLFPIAPRRIPQAAENFTTLCALAARGVKVAIMIGGQRSNIDVLPVRRKAQ